MTQLRTFRILSLAEGISLLTLLFIAMPLKYFMGMPEAVKLVGWIHGLLFILYVGALIVLQVTQRWSLIFFGVALLTSIVPFGMFIMDKQLRKKESEAVA